MGGLKPAQGLGEAATQDPESWPPGMSPHTLPVAHPGWQSPHTVSRVTVPAWASSLPRGLQREWGWHGLEPHEAEKVPGGQDLHKAPCPGSCGRERVRAKPGARPEVPGKPVRPSRVLPGQGRRAGELTKLGSSPGGHCQRVVDVGVARGQGSTWNSRQSTLERAGSHGTSGAVIYHPLPDAPGVGTTHHTGLLSPGFRGTL